MRVLVLGSGAREHALCLALAPDVARGSLFAAPGNAGMAACATCRDVDPADPHAVLALVQNTGVDLTIIGPELPLTRGVADCLAAAGRLVCGPSRAAAALESSKAFAKDLMARHAVPTAAYSCVDNLDAAQADVRSGRFGFPVVLKADGLAAGKGVVIAATPDEADAALRDMLVRRRFGDAGARVVIEEFMDGREASFFVLTDGRHARILPTAEDHKRAFDGDQGPNTGGMGAFSPSPLVDTALSDRILDTIVMPTLGAMRSEGHPFAGFLYVGLMLTAEGPKVVEFNARMGDPETQVVLPAVAESLLPHLVDAARGTLEPGAFAVGSDRFVGVVLASGGYPDAYATGKPISGLDTAAALPGVTICHAGTALRDGAVVSAGGRVLTVVGRGASFEDARARAYDGARVITFDGAFYRRDIGMRAGPPQVSETARG